LETKCTGAGGVSLVQAYWYVIYFYFVIWWKSSATFLNFIIKKNEGCMNE